MNYGVLDSGNVIARFVVPMTMRPNEPIFASDAISLKRYTARRNVQRWELETKLEPLTSGANDLFSLLVVAGHTDIVQIVVPQNIGVQMARTSTSTPTATGVAGANSITVASNTGIIARGTFIKFANHNKIYMLKAAINGNGAVGIYPNLVQAVPAGTVFQHRDDVIMNTTIDTDTILGMVFEDGLIQDLGTLKFIESL